MLVDEFQDTSRAQWELVRQLVRSWGEGFGAAADAIPPSIFIVGDRKQSIYGFRDADVAMSTRRRSSSAALRPRRPPRQAITVSFRSAPEILAFVNDVFAAIVEAMRRRRRRGGRVPIRRQRSVSGRLTRSRSAYRELQPDRSSWAPDESRRGFGEGGRGRCRRGVRLGLDRRRHRRRRRRDASPTRSCGSCRARPCAIARPACAREAGAADIAILFRSRDSHREFEAALDRRGVPTYVYKGLGFFDADEMQDAVALLRYLADPLSDLRAATLLRSRIVRLSDGGGRAARRQATGRGDPQRRAAADCDAASAPKIGASSTAPRARCRAGWRGWTG